MKANEHTPESRARAAADYRDQHLSVCRYRAQGLICSTCTDVTERAQRMARLVPRPAIREVRGRFAEIIRMCNAKGCGGERARGEAYCDRHVLVDAF